MIFTWYRFFLVPFIPLLLIALLGFLLYLFAILPSFSFTDQPSQTGASYLESIIEFLASCLLDISPFRWFFEYEHIYQNFDTFSVTQLIFFFTAVASVYYSFFLMPLVFLLIHGVIFFANFVSKKEFSQKASYMKRL